MDNFIRSSTGLLKDIYHIKSFTIFSFSVYLGLFLHIQTFIPEIWCYLFLILLFNVFTSLCCSGEVPGDDASTTSRSEVAQRLLYLQSYTLQPWRTVYIYHLQCCSCEIPGLDASTKSWIEVVQGWRLSGNDQRRSQILWIFMNAKLWKLPLTLSSGCHTGYQIPCPVMHEFTHYCTTVCIHLQALFLNSSFIMKSLLEKDIFHEMIVAHEIHFHMIPQSMELHIKWSGYLFYFPWHWEHFVHKCMAFHSTNGYWKDWLVFCLISIIATCRLGYTIRKIRDQSFQPYIAWVWTAKKEIKIQPF